MEARDAYLPPSSHTKAFGAHIRTFTWIKDGGVDYWTGSNL